MVQPDGERQLDDVILDVFEQAGYSPTSRHFYFPVTSQREARAFVKEIHTRGVHYSRICAIVGEREANFTAWRTGLNHPSIGNRIVERINRPLQQLLLAADDHDDGDEDVKLSDVEDDDDVLAQFSSCLPPTPMKTASRPSPCANGVDKKVEENVGDVGSAVRAETAEVKDAETQDHAHNDHVHTEGHAQMDHTHIEDHAHNSPSSHTEQPLDVEQSKCEVVSASNEENNNDLLSFTGAGTEADGRSDDKDSDDVIMLDVQPSTRPTDSEVKTEELVRAEEIEIAPASDGDDDDDDDKMIERKVERKDSWVTELSVSLSAGSETSDQHRQITVTSASSSSAAAVDQSCPQTTTTANTTTTTTTTIEHPALTVLHPTIADADRPDINGGVTSEPEVQTDSTVVTCTTTSSDCTSAVPCIADPHQPEVNDHMTSQPEVHTTTAAVVDNSANPEVVATVEMTSETTASDNIENSASMTSSSAEVEITAVPEVPHTTVLPEITSQTTESDDTGNSADLTSSTEETEVTTKLEMTSHTTLSPEMTTQTTASEDIENSTDMTSSTAEVEAVARPEVTSHITLSSEMTLQETAGDDATITGNSGDLTSSTAETEPAATPEVTSPSEMPPSAQSPKWKSVLRRTPGSRAVCSLDHVDESYDSDNDNSINDDDKEVDSESRYAEGRGRRRRKDVKRWGRQYQDDGPGYVYVFTDTAADCSVRCRVKVSASRRPQARLRQAQLFNVDMRLVTAVKVTRRLAAACSLREKLVDCAIAETVDWFNTSLDVVVNGVMDVSRLYSLPTDNVDH